MCPSIYWRWKCETPFQENNNWMGTWPWSQLSKETINLLKCCDFDLANDGTDDDFIHCLKKEQPCEGEGKKLSSQLWIIVDESNALDPFISPFDEDDTNKKLMWLRMKQRWQWSFVFFSLVLCQRKNLYQQYFEFVNKRHAQINAPVKS